MTGWEPREDEVVQRNHARANKRAGRLRAATTRHEDKMWKLLQSLNREGAHFRRQTAIGDLVFDFADLKRRLLIELDGGVHKLLDVALRDIAKAEWAASQGFELIRIKNSDLADIDAVTLRVRRLIGFLPHPNPSPQGGGATHL